MPINYTIHADVVDIRIDNPKGTDAFFIDTNVWYWVTYTRASITARTYQIQDYPNYIKKAMAVRAMMHRCEICLAELAHSIERTERKIYADISGFDERPKKEFRHNYINERINVVKEIKNSWLQVKTMTTGIDFYVNESIADSVLAKLGWFPIDGYDLFILEALLSCGITQIVTDDGDFATVPGIVVFTSNSNIIDAARRQNKLIQR